MTYCLSPLPPVGQVAWGSAVTLSSLLCDSGQILPPLGLGFTSVPACSLEALSCFFFFLSIKGGETRKGQ